jgi:hypothetical protein
VQGVTAQLKTVTDRCCRSLAVEQSEVEVSFLLLLNDRISQTSPFEWPWLKTQVKSSQLTSLRMPNTWHNLPSADSRSGCLHNSLGYKPRSDYTTNVRKGDPTPACSPVSDRRRLTALVEVHWARRVQVPMPQISGPNLHENHIHKTQGNTESVRSVAGQRTAE